MTARSIQILALSLILALAGCARQPVAPQEEQLRPTDQVRVPAAELAPARPFTSDTLYALLAAEIAGSREMYDIALANYVQQAHLTRDPQVAARATLIARFMNADELALETALLWAEVAPEDSEAQLTATLGLIEAGRLQEAFDKARHMHARGDEMLFQNIAARSDGITRAQREQLLEGYLGLLQQHPDNLQLLIGAGLLLQQQEQQPEALTYARRALALDPGSVHASLLFSSLLYETGEPDKAVRHLERQLARNPDSLRLRLHLARILSQVDLERAQREFSQLVDQSPHDPDLLLSLGLVALEREDFTVAQDAFEGLLEDGHYTSSAHYYLGNIAEQRDNASLALIHYLQVRDGAEFYSAAMNALTILARQGDLASARQHMDRLRQRFPDHAERLYLAQVQILTETDQADEADAILDEGLKAHPASIMLLYARAMMRHQRDNLNGAEADLRAIIDLDPDNAMALNALGYILTDRTDRHEEAFELITKALSIEPEDPAIIDSMGWVHYRLGNLDKAVSYLQRAMELYPDHEIASHLGEVLWVLGEKEQAREVWQQGLELKPDSPIIREAMERLTGE